MTPQVSGRAFGPQLPYTRPSVPPQRLPSMPYPAKPRNTFGINPSQDSGVWGQGINDYLDAQDAAIRNPVGPPTRGPRFFENMRQAQRLANSAGYTYQGLNPIEGGERSPMWDAASLRKKKESNRSFREAGQPIPYPELGIPGQQEGAVIRGPYRNDGQSGQVIRGPYRDDGQSGQVVQYAGVQQGQGAQPQNPMPGMPQQQQAPPAGNFPPMPANLSPAAQAQYENARQEAARRDRGQSRPASQNPMPGMPQQQQQQAPPSYPPSQYDSAAADFRRNGMTASPPSDPSGQAAAEFRRNGMMASPPQSRLVGGVDYGQHSGWAPRPFSITDPSTWVQWPSGKGPIQQTSEWADATDRGIQSAVSGEGLPAGPLGAASQNPASRTAPSYPPSQYDSARPPHIDLSGLNPQGSATGSTIPGMFMQGNAGIAGMVAGGMLTGSRMGSAFSEMESARQAQLNPNFVGPRTQNPMQDGPWDQRGSDQFRREAALNATPLPGSSNQAAVLAGQLQSMGVLNPMSAEAANQYNGNVAAINDPNRMTPDQKYAAAQQSAQRMGQSDPTNMAGRFGPDSALGQQAAKNAQNEASVAAGTQYEIPQGYGTLPEYRPIGQSPEVKYRINPDGSQGSSYLPNTDPVLGRQQAAARRQWGDLGSPAGVAKAESRRTRKAAETTRREGVKFRHMISQGMNPMSPQAQGMFPKQVAEMKKAAGQNPMQNPMQMGTPGSVEAQLAGTQKVTSDMATNRHLIAMGGKPGATLQDINSGVSAHLSSGGTFSDESLEAFQQHAIAQAATKTGEYDPFQMGTGDGGRVDADLWQELATLPNTPEARAAWAEKYKNREQERARRAADALQRNPPRAGA